MSCRHRISRVVLIHVHVKESRPRLAIRGKGEPEECRRVLLDIVKMFGYSSDILRHPLNRSPNDGRPKRDPEGHRHPCPSDASLMSAPAKPAILRPYAAMPPTRAPRARGTACPPPGQVTPAYTRPHGDQSIIRHGYADIGSITAPAYPARRIRPAAHRSAARRRRGGSPARRGPAARASRRRYGAGDLQHVPRLVRGPRRNCPANPGEAG